MSPASSRPRHHFRLGKKVVVVVCEDNFISRSQNWEPLRFHSHKALEAAAARVGLQLHYFRWNTNWARGWVAPGKRRVGALEGHIFFNWDSCPLDLSTAPKPQTPRSIAFALVHPPSSHLSLSTVPTSVMALLKLSTLALLALRAAAVFAAEVDVSQLFVSARLPGRIAIPISAPPCLGPRPIKPHDTDILCLL